MKFTKTAFRKAFKEADQTLLWKLTYLKLGHTPTKGDVHKLIGEVVNPKSQKVMNIAGLSPIRLSARIALNILMLPIGTIVVRTASTTSTTIVPKPSRCSAGSTQNRSPPIPRLRTSGTPICISALRFMVTQTITRSAPACSMVLWLPMPMAISTTRRLLGAIRFLPCPIASTTRKEPTTTMMKINRG